jgi:hypothetical protein
VQFQPIRWNFFETLGLRIVAGRTLTSNDHDQSAPVGVINESMARQVFGEPSPIGRWLTFLSGPLMRRRVEIVGVVSDAKSQRVTDDPSPTLYVPWVQIPPVPVTFEARTSVDPATLIPTVRSSVQVTAPGGRHRHAQNPGSADCRADRTAARPCRRDRRLQGRRPATGVFGYLRRRCPGRARENSGGWDPHRAGGAPDRRAAPADARRPLGSGDRGACRSRVFRGRRNCNLAPVVWSQRGGSSGSCGVDARNSW